jgi:dTDP-4-amino-4,6-dideoxygalactose transaminase
MIPLADIKAQYQSLREELSAAALRVLESGQYALGPEVEAFEREFAGYCGAGGAVAVNSGTSALHLALLAAGVGPGDEVITVPFTFVATVAAITYAGARPVFVDVEPRTLTMDPAALSRCLTPRTKAIIAVHLYGQMADMDAILEVARGRGIPVIEDAAQAHGATYQGRGAGAVGDFGCFSFYPSKNLGACGEGGLITARDPDHIRRMRVLRDWGQQGKYQHVVRGFNYRMDNLQAALLRVKFTRLESWTETRRAHAAMYNRLLDGLPLTRPEEIEGRRHVYHLYAIRLNRRDALRRHLLERGVQSEVHYPVPIHLMEAWCGTEYSPGDFPQAEQAAATVLSLPLYPELSAAAAGEVASHVRDFPGEVRE